MQAGLCKANTFLFFYILFDYILISSQQLFSAGHLKPPVIQYVLQETIYE